MTYMHEWHFYGNITKCVLSKLLSTWIENYRVELGNRINLEQLIGNGKMTFEILKENMEFQLWILNECYFVLNALLSKINCCGNTDKQRKKYVRKSYNDLFYFLGFFTELLIKSKLKFHRLFRRTYGIIYERNSDVFIDFFRDLESYYDHGNVRIQLQFICMILKKNCYTF